MMPIQLPEGDWRWIVVSTSGGKDSCAALAVTLRAAEELGVRDRVVLSHQCLGEAEWEGTLDLVKRHAAHTGLRLVVTKYRDREKQELSLLDYVRRRGKWPDSSNRYCTSEFKRGPGGRVITQLFREDPGDILNVYGFRAEESPARAKKEAFARNSRFSTKSREVWDWLPIHDWTLDKVWATNKEAGLEQHQAYALGMPRLSCRFCIFAPKAALMIAGQANPELLDKYVQVEEEINHSFRHKLSLKEVRDAIQAGEQPEGLEQEWNM